MSLSLLSSRPVLSARSADIYKSLSLLAATSHTPVCSLCRDSGQNKKYLNVQFFSARLSPLPPLE